MDEYEKLLDEIEATCPTELRPIFQCFYRDLNKDRHDHKITLNKGLNLFFGNFNENGEVCAKEEWHESLKGFIKEKNKTGKQDKNGNDKFKLKVPSNQTLKELTTYDYLEEAKKKWADIKLKLDTYFQSLNIPIQKTIIYEAPPYLVSIVDNEINTEFIAKFIFDKTCSSPYVMAIRNCFDKDIESIQDILVEEGVGFFDVIPIPIPINSNLRKLWATEKKFDIEGKRIFVHFFEWALEIYLSKLSNKIIKDEHKLAIGIPLKNAVTLYEYAAKNNEWPGNDLDIIFCAPHVFDDKNPKKEGLWVQPFKNCIIGSSNTPSGELMKLAFI